MILESVVCPLCEYRLNDQGGAALEKFHGTAFFINRFGTFLTAAHVLDAANEGMGLRKTKLGIGHKADQGRSTTSVISEIRHAVSAPSPYDVAVGQVITIVSNTISLQNAPVEVWQEVKCYGYPANAVTGPSGALNISTRFLKGHIQRITQPQDIPIGNHPNGFELSFLVSNGLSGAPVLIPFEGKDTAIGVCVASVRSEQIVSSHSSVEDNGTTFKETISRIEEFGLAHDIRPLLDWAPAGFGGTTLEQLSNLATPPIITVE